MLSVQARGANFEALYFRQLQLVTNQIHKTVNIDQFMLEVSQDICQLLNADRQQALRLHNQVNAGCPHQER